MLTKVTFDRIADDIGPMGHTATDHDDFRIDHVGQRRDSECDPVAEFVDHAARILVSVLGRPAHVDRIVVGSGPSRTAVERRTGQTSQCRPGCVLLPATSATARTLATTHLDDHMTDLAGETVGAANETPPSDDSPADSRADGHDQGMFTIASRADTPFGESRAIGVVVDRNPTSEPFGKSLGYPEVLDTGQVGRRNDHSVERHESGNSDPDRRPLVDSDLERPDQFDERIFDGRRAGWRGDSTPLDDRTTVVDHYGRTLGSTEVETEPKR